MSDNDLPTFDVIYYEDDVHIRVYLVHKPKTKNEHRELLRFFPAPEGSTDYRAAQLITELIINYSNKRG